MFKKKHLLFTRRRISFFLIPLLLISSVFILYQTVMFIQINNESNVDLTGTATTKALYKPNPIRGIHDQETSFYISNSENKFTCIKSLEIIDFGKVNDDYCDCLDGTDEPGTSACPNGRFFCTNQADVSNFKKSVPSSKVNDGLCDCCDGSDEWNNNQLFNTDEISQRKAGHFHVPCPKMC
ncbi:hypothetical protein NQ315_003164 [Exocentrus adspersus]|uniref:Glucosidase II beta subunit N-terminal domain-containing protein n=1 Tax=Exocentrus adspersus TaxID=1586481 RepID=A0AAV8W547_9CUCU|nr:hypothetical protein NQ315_003164 [Exocentrus adspersus]